MISKTNLNPTSDCGFDTSVVFRQGLGANSIFLISISIGITRNAAVFVADYILTKEIFQGI